MIQELVDQRLVIVTGKGGVGKTTIATALALQSARDGQRTLICEVNTKERVTQLLGKPEAGAELTSLDENLWAVNVRPEAALREYALMILKFESIYSAVFENRLVRYFLRFIPSLQELVMLGKILYHLKEKKSDGSWRFDRIVVDAPATGHAITFLSVPQVLLDTVPPGPLANEAKWMRDLLTDPKTTGVVLVSLPEELPVNETIELHEALTSRVKMTASVVVINAFTAPRFDEKVTDLTPGLAALAHVHTARATLSETSRQKLATLKLPVRVVPRLFLPEFGRAAIESIAATLEGRK